MIKFEHNAAGMNTWHNILETAVHCPSPHNVQPQRIKILDNEHAELLIDSTRTLPKEDPTGSFIILTMGMFLEAVGILSFQKGFKLDYELFHEPDWYAPAILGTTAPTLLPFARLTLSPAENFGEIIYPSQLFFKRRTSRLPLLPDFVPANVLETLQSLVREWQQKFQLTTINSKSNEF